MSRLVRTYVAVRPTHVHAPGWWDKAVFLDTADSLQVTAPPRFPWHDLEALGLRRPTRREWVYRRLIARWSWAIRTAIGPRL